MRYPKQVLILGWVILAGLACSHVDIKLPFRGFQPPSDFPAPVYDFTRNPVTPDGFALGRKLFYERALSRDSTISCGSCHISTAAFTHHGHNFSHGIGDRLGTRNAPSLSNLAWRRSFMWDGGVPDLDLQPIAPITDSVEMDNNLGTVVQRLSESAVYRNLFRKAFGQEEVSAALLLKALSQFMVCCISDQSKYDSVRRGQAAFNTAENAGYLLFQSRCSNCHTEPLFTDNRFRSNGLPPAGRQDPGRYAISLNPEDRYQFQVPSLRNLAYSAPYMHDGRFYSLEAVLRHYNSGVSPDGRPDPLLVHNGQYGIPLTDQEQALIISFLHTLNDRAFVTDRALAEY
ncbi:cytochrome c peroxidase [Niabella terrae]